nr:MAG TPA: hypothetical protein [Caudoviricetes sp.]
MINCVLKIFPTYSKIVIILSIYSRRRSKFSKFL